MRLTVIGCGHLGATHAACMAEIGHDVLGVDIDEDKVDLLNTGRAWFFEPGLDEMLARHTQAGRLRFTTSFAEAARFGTVHFLGVGTPDLPGGEGYDLSQVFGAARALAPHLAGPALIIGKSTVPPGTASRLAADLGKTAPAADTIEVAWNPEFLREGTRWRTRCARTGSSPGCGARWPRRPREIYRPLTDAGVPLIVTDAVTAELVKGAANAFLAAKVSFINAMSDICAATGASVATLADALGMDARIGRAFLTAGLGYGGGCLPKDVRGLRAFAASTGSRGAGAVSLLTVLDEINSARRQQVVGLVQTLLGGCPASGSRCGARRSSPAPTTCAIRLASTSPTGSAASARRSWCTTRGHGQRAGGVPAPRLRGQRGGGRAPGRRRARGHRLAGVRGARPGRDYGGCPRPPAHRRMPGRRPGAMARSGLDGRRPLPNVTPEGSRCNIVHVRGWTMSHRLPSGVTSGRGRRPSSPLRAIAPGRRPGMRR